VYGDKAVVKMLKQMPDKLVQKHLKAAMRKGMRETLRAAKINAPTQAGLPARTRNWQPGSMKAQAPQPVIMRTDKDAPLRRPRIEVGAALPQYFHLNILEGFFPLKPYEMPKPAHKRRSIDEGGYRLVFEGTNAYSGKRIITSKVKRRRPITPRPWLRKSFYQTKGKMLNGMKEELRLRVHRIFRELAGKTGAIVKR
jgi:hypothetical protein